MLNFSHIRWNARHFEQSLAKENRLLMFTVVESDENAETSQVTQADLVTDPEILRVIKETEKKYDNILKAPDSMAKKIQESLKVSNEMLGDLSVYRQTLAKTVEDDSEIDLKEYLPDEEVEVILTLNQQANAVKDFAFIIQRWTQGVIAPRDMVRLLEATAKEYSAYCNVQQIQEMGEALKVQVWHEIFTTIQKKNLAKTPPEQTDKKDVTLASWNTLTIEEKMTVNNNVLPTLEPITEFLTVNTDLLEKNADYFDAETLKMKQAESRGEEIASTKAGGLFDRLKADMGTLMSANGNIRWVSPLAIMEGYKQTKQAVMDAYQQDASNKGAGVAESFGKVLKKTGLGFLSNIDNTLTIANNERDQKVVDGIKGVYSFFSPEFAGVASDLAKSIARNNIQRNKAILLYAAGRGWLYHIEQTSPDPNSRILGFTLKELYGTGDPDDLKKILDYFKGENISGFNKEREAAAERVKRSNDAAFFKSELAKELKNVNLPAVMGIMKAAVKEGKEGSISIEMAVMITNAIRENPLLAKSISQEWITAAGKDQDQYKSSLGIGLFKEKDKKFKRWLLDPEKDEAMGESNLLTKVIGAVEKRAIEVDSGLKIVDSDSKEVKAEKRKELQKITVKIMTGEPYKFENGTIITAWDEEFKFFRDSTPMKEYDPPNPLQDEDFGYFQEPSGQIIRGQSTVDKILAVTGNGDFVKKDAAQEFVKKIMLRDYQLESLAIKGAISPDVFNQYRTEQRTKLNNWLRPTLKNSRATPFVDAENPLKPPNGAKIKESYMIAALVNRDLISRSVIKSAPDSIAKTTLLGQLDNDNLLEE